MKASALHFPEKFLVFKIWKTWKFLCDGMLGMFGMLGMLGCCRVLPLLLGLHTFPPLYPF